MCTPEPAVKFVVPLKETETTEGKTITLECETSKPHKIKWLKDGKPLSPDKCHQITQDGTTHRLIITDCTLADEAEYTVALPEDESKATLWVEGNYKFQ